MPAPAVLPFSFYARPTLAVARDLIGTRLESHTPEGVTGGRIVEVEAYLGLSDPASHAFRGPTPRATIMFGPPGVAYVYFSYGVHHCLNVVTEPEGKAGAVLIRALEPLAGIELMTRRRERARGGRGGSAGDGGNAGGDAPRRPLRPAELCGGPGRLCQALGIDLSWNGAPLTGPRLLLRRRIGAAPRVIPTRRIGITAAADLPYRFVEEGSPFLSPGRP
jgi:DNA-3-methyladenine glycosylase